MSLVGRKMVSMDTVVRVVAERQHEGRTEVQIAYVCPYVSEPISDWYPVRWLEATGWEFGDASAHTESIKRSENTTGSDACDSGGDKCSRR